LRYGYFQNGNNHPTWFILLINKKLKSEFEKDSTVREFRTVRKEGSRNVSGDLESY
jgi:hypothetical protein